MNGASDYTYNYTLEIEGQDYGYQSGVSYTWSNVSLVEGDYTGSFATSMTYPLQDGLNGVLMVVVTTQMDFIADGSGTGSGSIAGEEYVRFIFDAAVDETIPGVYTLKSEDWEIEHPISLYVYG